MSRLSSIDDSLWEATAEVELPLGVRLPARMTVIRTADGLALYSPIRIDDHLAAELEALGPVRHLVSPSLYHYLYLRPASERYPEATIWGPPGLAQKRPELRIDATLSESEHPFGDHAVVRCLGGAPAINEIFFLHRPSRSLICCDLVFNMTTWRGAMTGLLLRAFGTRGRFAMSRFIKRYIRDRDAARASLAAASDWDFERVVMAHGAIFEADDAPAHLAAAIAERLGG